MSLKYRIRFFREYLAFKKAGGYIDHVFPIYSDYREQAGTARGHYFHQDLLVASYIQSRNPLCHVDVGSRIDGFVAHVASFRSIEVIDVRDLKESGHSNIKFKQINMMNSSSVQPDICDSLSCLHAIEHFGLGRYGDPIQPDGHLIGFKNLLKMLKREGTLYISFPIGSRDEVHFNAHRVFEPSSILHWQNDVPIELLSFSYVDDFGDLHREVSMGDVPINTRYGCGIYTFKKI